MKTRSTENRNIPRKGEIKAPDGGWGWVVTMATFINSNIIGGVVFTFGALLPGLVDSFQQSTFVLCWILATQQCTSMVASPLISLLCNKLGYRSVMIIGGVTSAFGMLVSAYVNHVAYLFLTMGLIVGLGEGLINLPGVIMVSLYFDKKRPLATGITLSGYGSGVILYGFLVPYMMEEYTWRGTCIFLAGIFLQCCVCGALVRPLPEMSYEGVSIEMEADNTTHLNSNSKALSPLLTSNQSIKTHKSDNPAYLPSKDSHFCISSVIDMRASDTRQRNSIFIGSHSTVFNLPIDEQNPKKSCVRLLCDVSLLTNIPLLVFLTANFFSNVAFMAPITFILERSLAAGFTQFDGNTFLSVMGLFSWIGRLGSGAIASIRGVNRSFLFLVSLFCMGIPNLLMPFFNNHVLMFIYVIMYGTFTGKFCTLQAVVICDLVDTVEQVPSALTLLSMVNGWGTLVGNPLGGAIYDAIKAYDPVYVISGILFVSSAVLWSGVVFQRFLQKCRRTPL